MGTRSFEPPAELLERDTYADPPLDMDVVMKGGITSGVVYPLAVCELARRYRFHSVGGTSAGAIAAAAAAAAEVGRTSERGGYQRLATLPAFLGGEGSLVGLFQPSQTTRPFFRVLLAGLSGSPVRVVGAILAGALRSAAGIAGLVAGLVPGALLATLFLWGKTWSGSWVPIVVAPLLALAILVVLGEAAEGLRRPRSAASHPAPLPPECRDDDDEGRPAGVGEPTLASGRPAAAVYVVLMVLVVAAIAAVASQIGDSVLTWALVLTVLVLVGGVTVGAVIGLAVRLLDVVPGKDHRNYFGLVTGGARHAGDPPRPVCGQDRPQPSPDYPLTLWLGDELECLAGLTESTVSSGSGSQRRPLTFGDLEDRTHPVRLRMYTTNLTHGRPYVLPLETHPVMYSRGFFFDPDELRDFFPPHVVQWMVDHPPEADPVDPDHERNDKEWRLLCKLVEPLRPVPDARDLPVVVATRMSLSFPVLLSAVPLYAVDWSRKANSCLLTPWRAWLDAHEGEDFVAMLDEDPAEEPLDVPPRPVSRPTATVCWFSDGGISSNFPIHFFDSPLPSRPTVGVNLRDPHPDHPIDDDDQSNNVWIPETSQGGHHLSWVEIDGLLGFGRKIVDTLQNWTDNAQMRVHGYWDRIAHISLADDEGGMNLDMPPPRIDDLSERGYHAGVMLGVRFFAEADRPRLDTEWDRHRWRRYRSTMHLVAGFLENLRRGWNAPPADDPASYLSLASRAIGAPPTSHPFNATQRDAFAVPETEALVALAQRWWDAGGAAEPHDFDEGTAPRPSPELRISPPI